MFCCTLTLHVMYRVRAHPQLPYLKFHPFTSGHPMKDLSSPPDTQLLRLGMNTPHASTLCQYQDH